MRCLPIPVDAAFHRSRPLKVQDLKVDEMAAAVEAPFHVVAVPGDGWMFAVVTRVDFGGPENIVATALAHQVNSISVAQYVTGPAVLVGEPDAEGMPTDVAESVLDFLRTLGCTVV